MVTHKVNHIDVKKRQLVKLLNDSEKGRSNVVANAKIKELGKQLNIDWSIGSLLVKTNLVNELMISTNENNLEYGKNKKKRV